MMTYAEAKRVLLNTVIKWNGDPNDLGTVRKVSSTALYIDWENGQHGWIDFHDAEKVSIR